MKLCATLAGLTAVVLMSGANLANASTLSVPGGPAIAATAWSHLSQGVSGVLSGAVGHRGLTVLEDAQQSEEALAASGSVSCGGCDSHSAALPESATMILLGTVLLGTSFAARRLGKTHP